MTKENKDSTFRYPAACCGVIHFSLSQCHSGHIIFLSPFKQDFPSIPVNKRIFKEFALPFKCLAWISEVFHKGNLLRDEPRKV
jgi:hypothetical protein